MKILALESSAVSASVALTEDDKLIAQSFQNCGLTHSRTLLPMAEALLANCGVSLSEVDAFAVAHGPGSFTGVRIGVATVKGLALGTDRPCVGVSTLEAMAWGARSLGGSLCCVMDARAGQVYNALFEVDGLMPRRLCDDRALKMTELSEEIREAPYFWLETARTCVITPLKTAVPVCVLRRPSCATPPASASRPPRCRSFVRAEPAPRRSSTPSICAVRRPNANA